MKYLSTIKQGKNVKQPAVDSTQLSAGGEDYFYIPLESLFKKK